MTEWGTLTTRRRAGRQERFVARWILAVTVAETLGFAIPLTVGITLTQAGAPSAVLYAATVVAGAGEGALLGAGQGIGFGRDRPVPRWSWIAATAAGAAVAWSIGGVLFLVDGITGDPVRVVGAVAGGLVLILSLPTVQWLVLRRTVARSAWWIPATAGAWVVALPWTFTPSPLIDESTPVVVLAPVFALAGVLMALTLALLTGLAARRLVREMRVSRGSRPIPDAAARSRLVPRP